MWEAILWISCAHVCVWRDLNVIYLPSSGFPLAFVCLFSMWMCELFPKSIYTFQGFSFIHFICMTICVDVIQTYIHRSLHRTRIKRLYLAHARHHIHIKPTPKDSFDTAYVDAALQLVVPIIISIWLIKPDRVTIQIFGAFYSFWLQFIHSDPAIDYPFFDKVGLVTPKYHHAHHKTPMSHYAHIFQWC